MALKNENEYVRVIKKLNKLNSFARSKAIADVTSKQDTSKIEDALLNVRSIPGVGNVTAREILFAIGINL